MSIFVNMYNYLKGEKMGIVEDVKNFLENAEVDASKFETVVEDDAVKVEEGVKETFVSLEKEVENTVSDLSTYITKKVAELKDYAARLDAEIVAKTAAKTKAEAALKQVQSLAVVVPVSNNVVAAVSTGNTTPTT